MEHDNWRMAPGIPARAVGTNDPLDFLLDRIFAEEVGEWPAHAEVRRVARYYRPSRRHARPESFGWELDTSGVVIDAVGPHRMLAAA